MRRSFIFSNIQLSKSAGVVGGHGSDADVGLRCLRFELAIQRVSGCALARDAPYPPRLRVKKIHGLAFHEVRLRGRPGGTLRVSKEAAKGRKHETKTLHRLMVRHGVWVTRRLDLPGESRL